MISPNRTASIVEPILKILIVVFIVNLVYNWVTTDYEDDDTVTITFSCKQVLNMQNNYPDFVVQQCKQLRMQ